MNRETGQTMEKTIPLGRVGTPEDAGGDLLVLPASVRLRERTDPHVQRGHHRHLKIFESRA
jgi:hypothetical protein